MGSLRQAAQLKGTDVLVFEAGEGLRFDEMAIRAGVFRRLARDAVLEDVGRQGHNAAKGPLDPQQDELLGPLAGRWIVATVQIGRRCCRTRYAAWHHL